MTELVLDGLKAKQRKTWASGDYGAVAALIQPIAEYLVQAADLSAGSRVLDVAAGTGNASIAAARCGCRVTSTDFVPALLARGRERAEAEHLPMDFDVADAEDLPYPDGSFDAVISVVGAMFAPDQERVADELTRVCRSGGTIAMANWTPDGFIGQLFKTLGQHMPPPAGAKSPALWGVATHVRELFGDAAASIRITPRHFNFRYRSAAHFLEVFRTWYGPIHKAFLALPSDKGHALAADLTALLLRMNVAGEGSLVVPGEYAEIVVTRR